MNNRQRVRVGEIMRSPVVEVDGNLTILEAMKIMKREKVTTLIVTKRHERDELGMLLFSDIAKSVIANDRAPERVNVYEVMVKPVVSVHPDMDIRYCARMFVNLAINHAPVIDDGKVLGIVSTYLIVLAGLPDLD